MPNASSSQATSLAKRLFAVAGFLVSSCWIFPRREPNAYTPGDLNLDHIQDFHSITIKSITDIGQAAPAKTAIQTGAIMIWKGACILTRVLPAMRRSMRPPSNAIMNCCVQASAEASHGHETDAGVAILISPAGLA